MAGNAQVLYRKWRPQQFTDLVGQEHVAQTLRRAVAENRLSHAYLFTGPRGTGKTSTARILAKALNCAAPADSEPDGACESCVAIAEGTMMDLIEIDAASNRGIDDIRSLREKVQFSPSTGRYKVYIVDEVHMLTEAAFNALLKTLEEPPPHVILVLATTEPHKVPATIISRCQRFDFRRIPNASVTQRLAMIAEQEGFEVEEEALGIVARAAWGSLRDAQNLLEQLAISYGGTVTAEHVRELLGIGSTSSSITLASSLLRGDVAAALAEINRLAGSGADLRVLRTSALEAIRAALLIKTGVTDALSHPEELVSAMREEVANVALDRILHILDVLGQAELKSDSASPLPLELAAVRSAAMPDRAAPPSTAPEAESIRRPQSAGRAAPPTTPEQGASRPEPTRRASQPPQGPRRPPGAPSKPAEPSPSPSRAAASTTSGGQDARWSGMVKALSRTRGKRYVLGAVLRGASAHEVTDDTLIVRFTHRSNFERMEEELGDPRSRQAFEDAAEAAFGVKLKVRAVHGAGDESSSGDPPGSAMDSPLVRAAMTMGARIVDDGSSNGGSQ